MTLYIIATIGIAGWIVLGSIVLACLGAQKDNPKYYRKDGKL